MKRLFVPPEQLAPETRLNARQLHYLRDVLRLGDGDLEVFDGQGSAWRAELRGDSLRLGEKLPAVKSGLDVILVQALARGEKMDLVVQKATELGVTRVIPLVTERANVKLDDERGAAKARRWQKIAQEAARQCGRSDVPAIDEPRKWPEIFKLLEEDRQRRAILLDPEERALRLGAAARDTPRLLLAVGPEGGFSPQERITALQNGFIAAGLGTLVLRTETAGLAALAVILHLHGDLG